MSKKPVEPIYVVETGNGELFMGEEAYDKADELRKHGKLIESTRPEVQAVAKRRSQYLEEELIQKADNRQAWLGYGVVIGFLILALILLLT